MLTIATGDPAFPPYVIDDARPRRARASRPPSRWRSPARWASTGDAVTWVRTALRRGDRARPEELRLQPPAVLDHARASRGRVDSASRTTRRNQAIFGLADSPAAGATTIADLKGLKIGVAAGTTSLTYVEDVIQPDEEPFVFNDNADAKQALESNQIDAIVVDLPTALFITAVEIEGTTVFGQIEGSGTDEFGLVLEKDSPLVECVEPRARRR